MKTVRILGWLAALSPALAAAYWASFGARFPEPWLDRRAEGGDAQSRRLARFC